MTDTRTEHFYAEDFRDYADKQRQFELDHYDPFIDEDGNLNLCLSDILSDTAEALDYPDKLTNPALRLLLAEIRCILDGNLEEAEWVFTDSAMDAVMADLKVAEGIFDRRLRNG